MAILSISTKLFKFSALQREVREMKRIVEGRERCFVPKICKIGIKYVFLQPLFMKIGMT